MGNPGDSDYTRRLSVLIPVYNEEENILLLYEAMKNVLDGPDMSAYRDYEILFVDDGSSDGGPRVMRELSGRDPAVTYIRLRKNFGKTAALACGFERARGRFIITLDGDLQNDPLDFPRLLAEIEKGADIVNGWRRDRKDDYFLRILPSIWGNRLISKISGVKLRDYGCALKAYRADLVKGLNLYGEMQRYVPVYASAWGAAKVVEIEVRHHPRRFGTAKYGSLKRTFEIILDCIVMKFMEKYATKPFYIFGMAGFAMFGVALFTGGGALALKILGLRNLSQTPLPLVTFFLMMMGTMSLLMGLTAEMVMRTYYEAQRKSIFEVAEVCGVKQETRPRCELCPPITPAPPDTREEAADTDAEAAADGEKENERTEEDACAASAAG